MRGNLSAVYGYGCQACPRKFACSKIVLRVCQMRPRIEYNGNDQVVKHNLMGKARLAHLSPFHHIRRPASKHVHEYPKNCDQSCKPNCDQLFWAGRMLANPNKITKTKAKSKPKKQTKEANLLNHGRNPRAIQVHPCPISRNRIYVSSRTNSSVVYRA